MIASYSQGYLHLLEIWLLGSTLVVGFLWRAERSTPPAAAWILPASAVLVVACALGLYSEPRPGQLFEDLRVAYLGGARLVLSDSLAIYREPLDAIGPPAADFFANIPIVVLPFVPLTWLSERTAVWVFLGLGIVLTSLAALGLHRLTRPGAARGLWIAVLFLVCGPLYNSLREGNTTHLVLAALVLGIIWLSRGRDAAAGIVFGLCAVVKLPLLLLGASLLLRGRIRAAVGMAGGFLLAFALSIFIFGLEAHAFWLNEILLPWAGRPLGAFNVQSMDGLWVRLLSGSQHLRDWVPIAEPGAVFVFLRWVGRALLLGVTGVVLWRAGAPRTPSEQRHELAIALVLALLLSPITWSHYSLWLLIPLALIAGGDLPWPEGRGARALLIAAALCVLAPVQLVAPQARILWEAWARIGTSHAAFGALLLWGVLLLTRVTRVGPVGRHDPSANATSVPLSE